MAQRHTRPSAAFNKEALTCEKYLSKLANREKQLNQLYPASVSAKERTKSPHVQREIKPRPNVIQQNIPRPKSLKEPAVTYADESAMGEGTKSASKQRSKQISNKESWSRMLKEHKAGDKFSAFGNFDPLRTLHFLSKELQYQLQSILPRDDKLQQMVSDMQYALKRVPPELASQVYLLQGLNFLQEPKQQIEKDVVEEVETLDCGVQTPHGKLYEDNEKLQSVLAKLTKSCKQMESVCLDLRKEKIELQEELDITKEETDLLKKRIDQLEHENKEILRARISNLEKEKNELNNQLKSAVSKSKNQLEQATNTLKSQIIELKSQKSAVEQENGKLKHQIKLDALEREKFMSILALRNAQIDEIKTEMGHLQEMVNEQLLDVHNSAFQDAPDAGELDKPEKLEKHYAKEADNTLSTITTNEFSPAPQMVASCNSFQSFKDLETADTDGNGSLPDLEAILKDERFQEQLMEKLSSHTIIKSMFDKIKDTAYAVATSQRDK
ncbi:unnamed protein product [Phyllotreta striolata]|uniref:Uncharacterized protein n=1 Tax=Phyllotreta striolata TaxID=444603 RepID=A0A9N9TWG4_PHYSR|nr:unnamed protein product [Phyllotreta striolata]